MASIKCPVCNLTNWATSNSCKRCDFSFQEAAGQTYQPSSEFVPYNNSATFVANPSPTQINMPPAYNRQNYHQPNSGYYQNASNQGSQKRGLAILSLVMGILSFPVVNLLLGVLLSVILASIFGVGGAIGGLIIAVALLPASLIVSIVALKKTNKNPMEYGGKGMAIAGIVLSTIGLVTIPIVSAIAIPNLLAARRSANEASAIAVLRTITAAEETYKVNAGAGNCGELSQLKDGGLIDNQLATGVKNGYVFTVIKTGTGCDLSAKPLNENDTSTAIRSFYYSSEDTKIHFSNIKGDTASKNSPVLQ